MILDSKLLKLHNWRNFQAEVFNIPQESVVIVDANGSGKTSLLAAMYALCTGQSWPGTKFGDHLQVGRDYFGLGTDSPDWSLLGRVGPSGRLSVKYQNGDRSFPSLITYIPTDNLWLGMSRGSKLAILDQLVCGLHPLHAGYLKELDKLLRSKANLLKHQLETGMSDPLLGYQLTARIQDLSVRIRESRVNFWNMWEQAMSQYAAWVDTSLKHWQISLEVAEKNGNRRRVGLSEFGQQVGLGSLSPVEIEALWSLESRVGRVLYGAQRDDFHLESQHRQAEQMLSRGEMRLLVLFVKNLVATRLISQGKEVLWLLDDVFNELDSRREQRLFAEVLSAGSGFVATSTQVPAFEAKMVALGDLKI